MPSVAHKRRALSARTDLFAFDNQIFKNVSLSIVKYIQLYI